MFSVTRFQLVGWLTCTVALLKPVHTTDEVLLDKADAVNIPVRIPDTQDSA